MSSRTLLLAVALAMSIGDAQGGPLDYTNRNIQWISSPTATQDCIYFTLVGVSEADPAVPNQPWFAVPRTHLGFKEIMAIVLSAKASDRPVTVRTTDQLACGLIKVEYVYAI